MRLLCVLLFACFGFGECDTSNSTLKTITGSQLVNIATAPWHVGLFKRKRKGYMQACGGTIIARHVVVTAAHCVTQDRSNILCPVANLMVAAGKTQRAWNSFGDTAVQTSTVAEIKIPPRYQSIVANYQEDIALLILTSWLQYDVYVQPACLSFNARFDEDQLREGQFGKVVGWGLTGDRLHMSSRLRGASLPCISIKTCISESPDFFKSFITGDKICAGYKNGTALCRGDSGGGLVFGAMVNGMERVFLRGVVSTSPKSEDLCNTHTWAAFTHILRHEHFIKSVVPDVENLCDIPRNSHQLARFTEPNWPSENKRCSYSCV